MSSAILPSEPVAEPLLGLPSVTLRGRRSPRGVLAIASLGAAIAFVDATIVNIAFPDIAHSFKGTPISSLSWVLNAYNIVFAAFLVAAGRIADIVGRRRVFVLGLEVFTAASLLCAVAPSAGVLIAFRVVQALGAAMLVPSSLGLVMNAFPPERRSHGVALLAAVAAVAAGLGPSLGGLLVTADDWRLVFLVNLPIGLAAVVLARRDLVESRTPGRRRLPDLLGALLLALAVSALVLGVVKGEEWGWGSPRIVASFTAAVVLGAAFGWRCTRHPSPLIEPRLLRMRTFTVANAMTVVASAGFFGYTLCNVLFLTGVWHYSVLEAGLALTPGPLVAAAVAGPTSRLVQRVGPRPVLVAGGLIWGGAVLWLIARVGSKPAFISEWLPGIVLLGIGAGTLFPNLSGTAVAAAPGETFATASGLNSVARQVGAALGVAVVIAIIGTPSPLTAHAAFDNAWSFGAGCLIAAGIGCLLVGKVAGERAPALADAAKLALRKPTPEIVAVAPAPRARRAITIARDRPGPQRASSLVEFLGQVPLFAGLEQSLREVVAARASAVHIGAGEWLFHEGDAGEAMYIVRAGRLEVVDGTVGTLICELGRGDAVGELALLTSAPRAASVRAARTSDLVAIDRLDFDQLLQSTPALSVALSRTLAEQLRASRPIAPTRRPRPVTVALVALDRIVPLSELARGLETKLQTHLSAVLLDGGETGDEPVDDAIAAYGPMLDHAEATHDLVVLDGGSLESTGAWCEFCLQQADRILAVSSGRRLAEEVRRRRELRGCDLVVYDVAPGSGALAETATLLEPIESHLVRERHAESDLQRVARRLSGNSVGIVLSGGGARAFSHIGVLEELTEAGVTIDRLLGVSMGAFVGALFAMGLSGDEIAARCFDEWVQRRPMSDYTLPRHALIRGERARAMLERTFGQVAIEELPRNFMSGCADLRSGQMVISRFGPLREAVGFSMCLPVIAPPQVRGRELLIDGSLIDNLPVGVMADLGEGPIIAVDVKASVERPHGAGSPTAAQDGSIWPPAAKRPPSLGETLTRVLLLGSQNSSDSARRHSNLVIKPRAEGIGLLEFHQLDAAREAGRSAAREALAQVDGTKHP